MKPIFVAVLALAFCGWAAAQGTKISAMPNGNPAQSGDLIPVDRAGTNYAITAGSVSSMPTSSVTTAALNSVVYVDGSTYPMTNAGFLAALTAACNGTIPGKLVMPPAVTAVSLTASLTIPSNCYIQGPGKNLLTLQAPSGLTTQLFLISGVSNVTLDGFTMDGTGDVNSVDGVVVTGSSNVTLSNLLISNWAANGLAIQTGNTNVSVLNSEISRTGPALPGLGTGILMGGGINSHIRIVNTSVHDGNLGIVIFNGSGGSALTEDIEIEGSRIYANANDGIQVFANTALGGYIRGVRVENSEVYCNGWPASGSGFSAGCTAGYRQNGSTGSSSGVGVDLIGNLIQQPVVVGNKLHDNFFDGFSIGTLASATVTVSGATVTCTNCGSSAPLFNVGWKPNTFVSVGGSTCQIASVGFGDVSDSDRLVRLERSIFWAHLCRRNDHRK